MYDYERAQRRTFVGRFLSYHGVVGGREREREIEGKREKVNRAEKKIHVF